MNHYRTTLGLGPVTHDNRLVAAAIGHARWIELNGEHGHGEVKGTEGFIGTGPWERAQYYGYDPYYLGEVVHGRPDPVLAVDGWMETLYHRVILIRPDAIQMGYGGSEHFAVTDVGYGLPVEKIALRPYPGQSGVPVSWNALEIPSPRRLYPGAEAPTGPVITVSTGGRITSLSTASLTGPDGTQVPVMRFTPENDDLLVDSVGIIPDAPLQPGLTY